MSWWEMLGPDLTILNLFSYVTLMYRLVVLCEGCKEVLEGCGGESCGGRGWRISKDTSASIGGGFGCFLIVLISVMAVYIVFSAAGAMGGDARQEA